MPELPDIQVFTDNLNKLYKNKQLISIIVKNKRNLADTPKELSQALEGSSLKKVYRSGKEMRFKFSNGTIMGLHLMLTGDIIPFDKSNERKSTIVELYFADGSGLALTDRMSNAFIKLNPIDKDGIDALDKGLNYKYLKTILSGRKAQIKNILTDQNIIRGIGNSYSDEILWYCKISPFSVANAIPDEKIKELAKTIKKILAKEIIQIHKAYPDLIHGEVKDFMKIHSKQKQESPNGYPIKIIQKGLMKTYYTDEQKLYQ